MPTLWQALLAAPLRPPRRPCLPQRRRSQRCSPGRPWTPAACTARVTPVRAALQAPPTAAPQPRAAKATATRAWPLARARLRARLRRRGHAQRACNPRPLQIRSTSLPCSSASPGWTSGLTCRRGPRLGQPALRQSLWRTAATARAAQVRGRGEGQSGALVTCEPPLPTCRSPPRVPAPSACQRASHPASQVCFDMRHAAPDPPHLALPCSGREGRAGRWRR